MAEHFYDYVGPGHIPLLSAISEGLVTKEGRGQGSQYLFCGEPGLVGNNDINGLARLRLVDAPMGASPCITPDGRRVLEQFNEGEWWRHRYEDEKGIRLRTSRQCVGVDRV